MSQTNLPDYQTPRSSKVLGNLAVDMLMTSFVSFGFFIFQLALRLVIFGLIWITDKWEGLSNDVCERVFTHPYDYDYWAYNHCVAYKNHSFWHIMTAWHMLNLAPILLVAVFAVISVASTRGSVKIDRRARSAAEAAHQAAIDAAAAARQAAIEEACNRPYVLLDLKPVGWWKPREFELTLCNVDHALTGRETITLPTENINWIESHDGLGTVSFPEASPEARGVKALIHTRKRPEGISPYSKPPTLEDLLEQARLEQSE